MRSSPIQLKAGTAATKAVEASRDAASALEELQGTAAAASTRRGPRQPPLAAARHCERPRRRQAALLTAHTPRRLGEESPRTPPLCKPWSRAKAAPDLVTRDYTINLHKRLHGITFKRKAPRAIREIKKFAEKAMKTSDVRIDAKLNKHVWSKGVRNVPYRVRVRLSRKRNEDEEASEKLYTLVQHVEVASVKGLQTEVVADV